MLRANCLLLILLTISCISTAQVINFEQKIFPMDTVKWGHNYFGSSLKIHNGQLFIGDIGNDLNSMGASQIDNAGAVGVYELNGGAWEIKQKLVLNQRSFGAGFGENIAFADSGLMVSASGNDELDTSNLIIKQEVGSVVYLKMDSNGDWQQQQNIMASDRQDFDDFGRSIAVLGNEMFVASPGQDYDSLGNNYLNNAGAVYYFKRNANDVWEQKQKITSPERSSGDSGFGRFAALYDGEQLFIGGLSQSDSNGSNPIPGAGAVFVYEQNINGNWVNKQKITANHRDTNDAFGTFSNAIIDDYLIINSRSGTDENGLNYLRGAGAAFIFKRNASGKWSQIQKLVSPHRKINPSWASEEATQVYEDYLLIGAYEDWTDENDMDSIRDAGAVYLFQRNQNDSYEFIKKLVAQPRIFGQQFGYAVFMDSSSIMVSSIDERYGMLQRGVVNYFSFTDTTGSGGGTTYIKELGSSDFIRVYPNPADNLITLEFLDLNDPVNTISLMDLKGNRLLTQRFNGQNSIFPIELNDLSPGMYIIQVIGDKRTYQTTFVKQ